MGDVSVQHCGEITRIVLSSPAARSAAMRLYPGHELLYGTTLLVHKDQCEPYLEELSRAGLKIIQLH